MGEHTIVLLHYFSIVEVARMSESLKGLFIPSSVLYASAKRVEKLESTCEGSTNESKKTLKRTLSYGKATDSLFLYPVSWYLNQPGNSFDNLYAKSLRPFNDPLFNVFRLI
jgi:hypothetical protein